MHESQRLMKKQFVLNFVKAKGKVGEEKTRLNLFLKSKHEIKELIKFI